MKAIAEEPKPAQTERKPRVIYPPGYPTDSAERRRIAKELRGSIPDIMTQVELQELRQKS
jgi:hypothetical protein